MNIEAKFDPIIPEILIEAIQIQCIDGGMPEHLTRFSELNRKLFPPDSLELVQTVDSAELAEYFVILTGWAKRVFELRFFHLCDAILGSIYLIHKDLGKTAILETAKHFVKLENQARMNKCGSFGLRKTNKSVGPFFCLVLLFSAFSLT